MKFTFAIAALLAVADVSAIKLAIKDDEEVDHSGEWYTAQEIGHGFVDAKYERKVPAAYEDDGFMSSMIMNYAMEGKTKKGDPNGVFMMNESTTKAAANEVLGTHKKLAGADLADYMKQYYGRTWAHFDVNHSGMVDVQSMPQFMRFLASDKYMSLQ